MTHQLTIDLRSHLAKHWHHHLALWGILVAALSLTIAGAALRLEHGGFIRSHLPPPLHLSGSPLPAQHSLVPFIVRIHNQGSSNSCVAQTLSTIEEITARERHPAHKGPGYFSAGYIYDQINGGRDEGSSYDDAFRVLTTQGDAPKRYFPHDGIDWWVQPTSLARSHARRYRFTSFRSIAPSDRYTIEAEIAHGRPVALALPVYDSFYNLWNDGSIPAVWQAAGSFHFWHSITLVGYDRVGAIALNSWGPLYGHRGLVRLAWPYIAHSQDAIVVSHPYVPLTRTNRSQGGKR